jgi:hypothetical protein
MRRDLIRTLIALEASARIVAPGKPMLPAWLLEDLVNQGARLTASGELDLAWLRDCGESGGLTCTAN